MDGPSVKYSVPLRFMWERFHEWTMRMHNQDNNAFSNTVSQYALSQPSFDGQQTILLQLKLWNMDFQGNFLHVWFEKKELYDFLQNDVELKELSNIKHYLYINGKHLKERNLYGPSVEYNIALHVPYLNEGFAFSFCLMADNTITLFFDDVNGAGTINESQYNLVKSQNDEDSLDIERNFRFAVNLLAYMECFPECVHEGVPKINNEPMYRSKGRNISLGVSEKVLEEDPKGVKRPHMRKGYFKCLSSDFYKNKRGQIIFVRETMVKGKSKTVDMSDDEKKVDEFKHV